ncbi:MAG: HD domain-containing phosphohydrolase [candidate division Zixibacteria bacterium]
MMTNRNEKYSIIVIDDETYICNIVKEALSSNEAYRVKSFSDPGKALTYLEKNHVDLVLTDLVMGEFSGVDILETAFREHPDCILILMTAHPTVNNAISVLKKGAYDYLVKPFKLETLKSAVVRGLRHQALARENVHLKEQLALHKLSEAIGSSTSLQSILDMAADTAKTVIGVGAVSVLVRDSEEQVPIPYIIRGSSIDEQMDAFLNGNHKLCAAALDKTDVQSSCEEIIKKEKSIRTLAAYPLMSRGKAIGLLNVAHEEKFMPLKPGQLHLLSIIAAKVASAIENNRLYEYLQSSYLKAIKALANAIEARDPYTRGHTDRVTVLADLLASRLNWSMDKRAELKMGCTLHDIGKIGIPDAILNKPGRLTDEERAQIQMHPELGAKMIEGIDYLEAAVPYILYHHEQYDGSGYPRGLAGEEIPIEGRLLAVVDTYDAIVTHRPYRQGADPEKAIDELEKFKGKQFDPIIVDVIVSAWKEGLIEQLGIYPTESCVETQPA